MKAGGWREGIVHVPCGQRGRKSDSLTGEGRTDAGKNDGNQREQSAPPVLVLVLNYVPGVGSSIV